MLISGANKMCVEYFLNHNGLTKYFHKLYCLDMEYCHKKKTFKYQHEGISCERPICTHGYCKGIVVKDYLQEHPHERVYYFGDGANDLCGINEISQGTAFVR